MPITITGWVPNSIAEALIKEPAWVDGYSAALGHHAQTPAPLAERLRYMTPTKDEQTGYDRNTARKVTVTVTVE